MNTYVVNTKQTTANNKIAFLLAILFFIRIRPYYLWSLEDIVRPVCAISIMLISILNFSREKYSGIIFFLLVAAYIWASLFVDGSPVITVLNFVGFAFIPLIRKKLVLDTYVYFKKIFTIVLVLCIINYILSLIGLSINLGTLQYENGPQTMTFIKQPFYIQYIEQSSALPRFNGIFDEPGVIGTICGLLLICERMNFKDRLNRILLIAGILSMSFYFFITLAFGLLLFTERSKNKWLWIFILAFMVIASYSIPQAYDTIWSRFEWDADVGTFVGDNRQNQTFINFWDTIKGTPLLITGVGASAASDYIGSSASLLVVIAKHGLLFVVPIMTAFAIMSYREFSKKKLWLVFIFYFILTLYQRPGFYSTYSLALYTMVIYQFSNHISINEK